MEELIRAKQIKRINNRIRFARITALLLLVIGMTLIAPYYIRSRVAEQINVEMNLPNPPVTLTNWLNNEIEQMRHSGKGVLLHNIPTEMTVENKEIIEVRVAKKLLLPQVTAFAVRCSY